MILVDTNVLARSLQSGHAHHRAAVDAMAFLRLTRQEALVISPQVCIELYVTCTRAANGLGLSAIQAIHELSLIKADFPLLPESASLFPQWESLIRKYLTTNRRVFDLRLVAFMLVHTIDTILTFNDQDFHAFTEVQVLNPFDLLGIPRQQ